MSERKTILFVTPYFPPHPGGLEQYAYEVAVRLCEKGWRVIVLTSGSETRVTERGGCTVHELRTQYKISNTPWSFHWWRQVGEVLTRERPSLVVIHTPVPGLGDIAAWRAKVPVVVTYHAGSMRKGSLIADLAVALYESFMLPLLIRRAAHVVCVSNYVRDFLERRGAPKECSIISPGVATDRFMPDTAERDHDPTVLCVAALGRAERYKGVSILIDSFRDLLTQVPHARLRIVGTGDYLETYREQCRAYGIADRVTFTGALSGDALVREYQRASVFALPTSNESFGMVIAEAMASGLPIVSVRTGGIPSLVVDGVTGDLVAPGDWDGFSQKLINLVVDRTRCVAYGARARERVREHFTWSARVIAYESIFEQLLAVRPTLAVVSGYYPPHVGGMETVAEVLAHLSARTRDVHVFTSRFGAHDASRYDVHGRFTVRRLLGVEIAHTPILPGLFFRIARLPRESIVHVHVAQAFIPEVSFLAARLRNMKFIAHIHLDVARSGTLGFLLPLYKRYVLGPILRRADLVLVLTESQAQFVREQYHVPSERIAVLPNGVAVPAVFGYTRRASNAPLEILCVGRMTVQKRFDRAIDAASLLRGSAILTIVGDGEDRHALEARARERGVSVIFAGAKSPDEVRRYYERAHVFFIPSDHEGMPLVVLEAMAAGLPVVGGAVPGVRELVDGVGVLVDPPSPGAFAAALDSLADEKHRIAVATRCFAAVQERSWERVATTLEAYYERVCRYV